MHDAFRGAGDDAWISVAMENNARLRDLAGMLQGKSLADWMQGQDVRAAERMLRCAGIPAAALATASDLAASAHLCERGFWDAHGDGVLPGLPWRASIDRASGHAPSLGGHTEIVLAEVLGLSHGEIDRLRQCEAIP